MEFSLLKMRPARPAPVFRAILSEFYVNIRLFTP